MGLILSNNNINKLYYGSSEVSKIYLGAIQVYPSETSYIPNPNITTFIDYQNKTSDNGRYLNIVKQEGVDYTNADYPSIICKESITSGANRIVRIYGKLTCPSDTDWVSYYGNTTNYTLTSSSGGLAAYRPTVNLSYAYNDNKRLRQGTQTSYLPLLEDKSFIIDIPASSTSTSSASHPIRFYHQLENGEPNISTLVVSNGDINFANGSDSTLQIGYGNLGINKDYVEIDLAKSGVYTYTTWDEYVADPTTVSLEDSIMIPVT